MRWPGSQIDLVVDALQRAREVHDGHLVLVAADPKWDALRDEPRIQEVIASCRFQREPRPAV